MKIPKSPRPGEKVLFNVPKKNWWISDYEGYGLFLSHGCRKNYDLLGYFPSVWKKNANKCPGCGRKPDKKVINGALIIEKLLAPEQADLMI